MRRFSMMRTLARWREVATVLAWRLKSRTRRPKRLSQIALEQPL
jgi:hypothetical protein